MRQVVLELQLLSGDAGDDKGLQVFSIRMDIAERRVDAIKLTLDGMIQELKRLSLKIDNQSLADGTYQSGLDRSAINLPPPPPPLHPPQKLPPYHPSTNLPPPPPPSHLPQQPLPNRP